MSVWLNFCLHYFKIQCTSVCFCGVNQTDDKCLQNARCLQKYIRPAALYSIMIMCGARPLSSADTALWTYARPWRTSCNYTHLCTFWYTKLKLIQSNTSDKKQSWKLLCFVFVETVLKSLAKIILTAEFTRFKVIILHLFFHPIISVIDAQTQLSV